MRTSRREILLLAVLCCMAMSASVVAQNQAVLSEIKNGQRKIKGGLQSLISRGILTANDDSKTNDSNIKSSGLLAALSSTRPRRTKGYYKQRRRQLSPKNPSSAPKSPKGSPAASSTTPRTQRASGVVGKKQASTLDNHDDDWNQGDDAWMGDDYYSDSYKSGKKGKKSSYDRDDDASWWEDDDIYDEMDDDYYYKSGKKSSKKYGSGDMGDDWFGGDDDWFGGDDDWLSGDDDFLVGDDDSVFITGDGRFGLTLQAFQFNTASEVKVPSGGDDTSAGTVVFYRDAQLLDLVNVTMSALIQGECTRTDPDSFMQESYRGAGYCQFTYDFLDETGTEIVAQMTAEGPVANGDVSTLAITGGTGELSNTIGQLDLYPARFDGDDVVRDSSLDFLGDLTDGYDVEGTLFIDLAAIFF